MKRLVIHLKRVDKVKVEEKGKLKSKIFNTLNIPVKNDKEIAYHLGVHGDNVKSHRVSFIK